MLKRLTLLAFSLLFTAQIARAQFGINVGPLVGGNISGLTNGIDSISTKSLFGFVGGAFVRLNISKFYIQPEAVFSMKGSSFKVNDPLNPGNPKSYDVRFSNIDIPLLVGYKLIDAKLINVRVHLGPMASFAVSNSNDFLDDPTYGISTPKDAVNTAQWSYQIGAGVDVWKFTLDLRYEGSFNTALQDVPGIFDGNRNSIFRFSLGYKII